MSDFAYLSIYLPFKKSIPHASSYPIITNVVATSAGLITWTTDVASTSQVLYGTLPLLGLSTTQDSTLVTSHSVQLSGLSSGTYYYFKVQSFNKDALSISDLYVVLITIGSLPSLLVESGIGFILLEDGTKILLE